MTTRKYITGNLAADPELAFSQAGKAWARFTVISNDGYERWRAIRALLDGEVTS